MSSIAIFVQAIFLFFVSLVSPAGMQQPDGQPGLPAWDTAALYEVVGASMEGVREATFGLAPLPRCNLSCDEMMTEMMADIADVSKLSIPAVVGMFPDIMEPARPLAKQFSAPVARTQSLLNTASKGLSDKGASGADLLRFMFVRRDSGGEDALMHDALTLAAALCPGVLIYHDYFVDIECEGTYTFGHTMVDLRGRTGRQPNTSVAVEIDLPRFKEWLYTSIAAGK